MLRRMLPKTLLPTRKERGIIDPWDSERLQVSDFKHCAMGADCCHPNGPDLPASEFYNRTEATNGLQSYCIPCSLRYKREHGLDWRQRAALQREYYYTHRQAILERGADYRLQNREAIRNRERIARPIRAAKKAQERLAAQIWRNANRDLIAVTIERRRARMAGLPDLWAVEQWRETLRYFDYSCAVCGHRPDGKKRFIAADHWIPIASKNKPNPGTVAWNIVPLCHGAGGCNNSKSNQDARRWLERKYGKTQGLATYRRINTFLEDQRYRYARYRFSRWQRIRAWMLDKILF